MKRQVKELLLSVVKWAVRQPDILGVALVGSHARDKARPDSDVDLVLIATKPQRYINRPAWINNFGTVTSCAIEDWGLVQSLRVFYEGNLEVEFGMTTTEWPSEPIDEGTHRVIADGMKVLLDKTGLLTQAQARVLR